MARCSRESAHCRRGQDASRCGSTATGKDGLEVHEGLHLPRGSYVVDVALEITQSGSAPTLAHVRLFPAHARRQAADAIPTPSPKPSARRASPASPSTPTSASSRRCTFATSTRARREHVKQATDGWLAIVQHYFVSAWLPPARHRARLRHGEAPRRPLRRPRDGARCDARARRERQVDVPLYAGPQEQRHLQAAAPGLDLVVDYGWLADHRRAAVLAAGEVPRAVRQLGLAIILLTVLIKLVFFPLSAASYKSMAKMKLITPRLTKLREMYGDDRAEDEPGDDGAVQDREDQPARRLLADPGADPGVHRAVLGAAGGGRAAPRAVDAVDQGPVGARSVLRAADPDDGHHGHADQAESRRRPTRCRPR